MSWPEAIFYSVLVICALVALVILIGIALLLSAFSSPRKPSETAPDYHWVSWKMRPAPTRQEWKYERTREPVQTSSNEKDEA